MKDRNTTISSIDGFTYQLEVVLPCGEQKKFEILLNNFLSRTINYKDSPFCHYILMRIVKNINLKKTYINKNRCLKKEV